MILFFRYSIPSLDRLLVKSDNSHPLLYAPLLPVEADRTSIGTGDERERDVLSIFLGEGG